MLELTNHGYMRIIMLNNIYKHYLEIIFKIRKEKGEDNMAKKLFMTIYGRNLVGELKNIVQRPYLVVTMEDLWDRFKDEFDDDCIVHFVKTLEYDEIMAEVEGEIVEICVANGQVVDYGTPLFYIREA